MRVTTVDDRCRPFFFDLFLTAFDDFDFFEFLETGYWMRCFGNILVHLGDPGGHLGVPGGGPGGVLELSGGVRGASWEGLGRSWGDLGATFKAVRFRIDFLIDFELQKGAKREAFGEPKWSQNRSQNHSKSKTIFESEKNALQDALGPVLGRS